MEQFKVPRRPRPKETGNMDCTANIREALFRSTKTICLIRPRDLNYEESIMQELDETNIMDMQEFDETTNTDIASNQENLEDSFSSGSENSEAAPPKGTSIRINSSTVIMSSNVIGKRKSIKQHRVKEKHKSDKIQDIGSLSLKKSAGKVPPKTQHAKSSTKARKIYTEEYPSDADISYNPNTSRIPNPFRVHERSQHKIRGNKAIQGRKDNSKVDSPALASQQNGIQSAHQGINQYKATRQLKKKIFTTAHLDSTTNVKEALVRTRRTICLIRPPDVMNYEESIMQELDETDNMDIASNQENLEDSFSSGSENSAAPPNGTNVLTNSSTVIMSSNVIRKRKSDELPDIGSLSLKKSAGKVPLKSQPGNASAKALKSFPDNAKSPLTMAIKIPIKLIKYDDTNYDPKNRGCKREGLRVRRFQKPWWVHDGSQHKTRVEFF